MDNDGKKPGFTLPRTLDPMAQAADIIKDMLGPTPTAENFDGGICLTFPCEDGGELEIWLELEAAMAFSIELMAAVIQGMEKPKDGK